MDLKFLKNFELHRPPAKLHLFWADIEMQFGRDYCTVYRGLNKKSKLKR